MEQAKTVIEPQSRFSLHLSELWQYRELFYFFAWRDIKVKYKQTYLGVAWAVLQPLGLILLFTYIFSDRFKHASGPMHYEVFVLSGLILWNFFQSSVSNAADSIIQQSNIIKKIYFPRLLIPLSSILVAFFDFIIVFLLFLIFCFFFKQPIHLNAVLYFPCAILFTAISSFGIGTFLAALNVRFRDFRYVLPFTLQFLFFASQVIYSIQSMTNNTMIYLLALNPVNGAIELFRMPLSGVMNRTVILISLTSLCIFFIVGLYHFKKTEGYFADLT